MPQSSILDPIHDTLPPDIWGDADSPEPKLRPLYEHFIARHVYGVLERGGYSHPHEWLKLYFTGSLCTYQYGPTSDADISLFVDATLLPEWSRSEMIGLMIAGCDGVTLPHTPYEIQAYVVSKGIHPADLFKPGLRAGYSIDQHRWINPPDKSLAHDVEAQENGFYAWALQAADKMERLLRYEPDKAVDYWHQIHKRRMRDQTAGKGDYSEANILFKFLGKRGLLPQIAQASGEHIAANGEAKMSGWQDHFVNQIQPIAQAYAQMPNYDPQAVGAWQELAADSTRRANELRKRLNISVTDNPEPYPDAQAMFDDINRGNFVVSRANCEHPIWTPEQNVDFRIVHDVMGHHPTGGDFGWQGENLACGNHFGLLTPNAQRALMTECLGQTGYAIANGGFGAQKVGFMDHLLQPAQQAFSSAPQGGFCHRHIRHGIYRLERLGAWTSPAEVSLTTQPPQNPMQDGPSPFANTRDWQINTGNTNGIPDHGAHIQQWMLEHFPDVPFQVQEGLGGWAGDPESSVALHLFATPHPLMKQILEAYGRDHPEEEAFAVKPEGHEGYLWMNPSAGGAPTPTVTPGAEVI